MSPDLYRKKTCRYCDHPLEKPFLDLGIHPLANSFVKKENADKKEFECPLALTKCPNCHLIQLTHVVPPDLMFLDYLYVSSTTQTFRKHFADYAQDVKDRLIKKDHAVGVDIGSNDGLLVSCYEKVGMKGIGVEPAKNLSAEANRNGITTINRYFDAPCVQEILSRYGKASVISANNVFAHIDDIQSVCKNVNDLLDDRGFFVIEYPYLVTMLEKMFFDMIYHEHLSYIGITALAYLFKRFDLKIFDIKEVSSHGGSLRVFVQKKQGPYETQQVVQNLLKKEKEMGCLGLEVYERFAEHVFDFKKKLTALIDQIKKRGETIAGYGAPAKGTTIINFCQLTPEQIDYIVDDNPLKQDRLVPGRKIPIVPSAYLNEHPTDYVLIFAWNFAREIISKVEHLKAQGVKFIIPLPEPTTV